MDGSSISVTTGGIVLSQVGEVAAVGGVIIAVLPGFTVSSILAKTIHVLYL